MFLIYLSFCSDFCDPVGRWLDDKANINCKIYDVTNYNTILHNISRIKDNCTIKFSQLAEYNIKNIFLKITYSKCGAEASPTTF